MRMRSCCFEARHGHFGMDGAFGDLHSTLAFSLYHDINVINSEIILGIFTCDGCLMMSRISIAPCSLVSVPVQAVMLAATR